MRLRSLRKEGKNFVVEGHDSADIEKTKEIGGFQQRGLNVNGEPRG